MKRFYTDVEPTVIIFSGESEVLQFVACLEKLGKEIMLIASAWITSAEGAE